METTLDIKITDLLTPLCYGPSTIPREINSPSSSLTNQIHTQSILCWCSCHISFSFVGLWSQRQIRISMLCMSLWIKRPSALCGLTCTLRFLPYFSHVIVLWDWRQVHDKIWRVAICWLMTLNFSAVVWVCKERKSQQSMLVSSKVKFG